MSNNEGILFCFGFKKKTENERKLVEAIEKQFTEDIRGVCNFLKRKDLKQMLV